MRVLQRSTAAVSSGALPFYTNRVRKPLLFSRAYCATQPSDMDIFYNGLLNTKEIIPCNFVSQIVNRWAVRADRPALFRYHEESDATNIDCETITYHQLIDRGHQLAEFLKKQGLQKGDTVALALGQDPAWWYSLVGLWAHGIAVVPCSRLLTAEDLEYRIQHLEIRAIITVPGVEQRIDAIRSQCPSLTLTLTTGERHSNWIALSDIINTSLEKTTGEYAEIHTTSADPCIYLYTSGTTGQPKPVMHGHGYPFFHRPTATRWLKATSDDVIYNASDTGWGFSVWTTVAAWTTGARILIAPTDKRFNATRMLGLLENQSVTIFCAAPTVLRLLAADPHFKDCTFPKLKRIITVGEALDETVINAFKAKGIEIHVGFGQAETPLLMARLVDQPHVPGTMGQPVDPYHIILLDDHLKPVATGQIGQIAVDLQQGFGNALMKGYAKSPEATQRVFSPDGRYYLTGDWAMQDAAGYFYYQGRKDDLIKSYGYRVGPDEVEKAGMSHPAVAKIAVVGVPMERGSLNHIIKAFVLLKPDYENTPALLVDIQNHIKQKTAPYKYPRKIECLSLSEWMQFETISGKVRRSALRERENAGETNKDIQDDNQNTKSNRL